MLGYGDGIILGSNDGEILVSTLGAADRNKIGIDEGTFMGSPYGSFDCSNEVKPVGLLFGEAIGSDEEKNVPGLSGSALEEAKDVMLEG